MKKNIAYWLLARFPRPVAVFYAMLVQAVIDNIEAIIGLSCAFVWFSLIILCLIFFGMTVAAAFVIISLGLFFLGVVIGELAERYKKFDEALPKREKKEGE